MRESARTTPDDAFGHRLNEVAAAFATWARAAVQRRAPRARAADDGLVFNNRNDGPPDLDELWRDFNRKLSGLFGGKGGGGGGGRRDDRGGPGGGNFQPDMKSAGIGAGLIAGVAALIWLGSGFYIVQEGQQAVVTTFGKYSQTKDAGFQWRLPYPVQAHETVAVTQLQSVEVGRTGVVAATGLRDSSMLTQ
ncbi:MAG: protease modulator HflK, partial [Betaproteobacteria bacterium]